MGEHDHDGPDPRYDHSSGSPSRQDRPPQPGQPMRGAPERDQGDEPAPVNKPSQAEGER
jgi:hypothetical protein